jgi:hypothetical protein
LYIHFVRLKTSIFNIWINSTNYKTPYYVISCSLPSDILFLEQSLKNQTESIHGGELQRTDPFIENDRQTSKYILKLVVCILLRLLG